MKRGLAVSVLMSYAGVLGGIFACDPGPISATMFIEKLVPGASGSPCYSPCLGSAVAPAGLVPDECSAPQDDAGVTAAISCGFVEGVDTMRVIVAYGMVDLDNPSGFAGPQLVVTGDGTQTTKATMTPGPVQSGNQSLYASLELTAPAHAVDDLTFQVTLAGGDVVEPSGSFSVGPVTATLTLERLIAGPSGPCFAPCEGSSAPSNDLSLVGTSCVDPTPVSCGFTAGSDKMRIVADYGPVAVTSGAGFAGAQLQITGDGAPLSQEPLVLQPLGTGGSGQHAFAEVELTAPSQTVAVLGIQAALAGGTIVAVPGSYSVSSSSVTVDLPQCTSATTCTAIGGSASVAVNVTVPGAQAETVTLTTSVDGVPQPGTQTVQANTPTSLSGSTAMTGTGFISVPSVAAGATWQVQAQVGSATGSSQAVSITAPTISAAFTCGSQCSIKAGSTQGLTISAPIDSSVTQATVNTFVDGSPSLVGTIVSLTTQDANAKTISGILQLPVPTSAGSTWEIDTAVGAYAAQSIVVSITN